VSYGARLDAILRYTAMNDRRIRMLLELIDEHCKRVDDEEAWDGEDRALEQNEPNWKRPAGPDEPIGGA
jgi:hypothetical protein